LSATIRADLTVGAAYGLAASAAIWSLVLRPPVPTATDAMLVAFGAAAGAVTSAFRGNRRLQPVYPVTLAALLLSGPFIACAAGFACALAGALHPLAREMSAGARAKLTPTGLRLSRVLLACAAAAAAFGLAGGPDGDAPTGDALVIPIAAHAAAFAVTRTLFVLATAIGFGRSARLRALLRGLAATLPGCLIGSALGWAAAAGLADEGTRGLVIALLALGATWSVHRVHGRQRSIARHHDETLGCLSRNVTRALARVMEERDPSSQDHLRRVHRLCVGVGQGLEVPEAVLETIGSAAMLHDIGKVSVPESILQKPGKLTREEQERVKRHAITGAEIVQALPFGTALAPVIRHHHERWDGTGYPDGLEGEQIPLAARIVAAVDCYDALVSDRPYRKALTHREAASFMEREAGRMFDPEVVETLLDYLESRCPAICAETESLAVQDEAEPQPAIEPTAPGSLAVAQRELETLYDVARALGYGLTLDEFLTLAGCRLSSLVPFESLVVYFADHRENLLRAHFAMGRGSEKLRLMTVPIGERLSGWAASQQRAAIGRDHVAPVERDGSRSDLEDWKDDAELATLRATLAAPLIAEGSLVGVVTLYDEIDRAFTEEDRRILVRVAGYMAQLAVIANEEPLRQTSLTDPRTGVPNARFLWLESAHRMTQPESGFGLVALRVAGLDSVAEEQGNEAVDRLLGEVARRFASRCQSSETLVRMGPDLFVVLTAAADTDLLVERWQQLVGGVEQPIADPRTGQPRRLQVTASHARFPEDGSTLDGLLEVLDRRMTRAGRGDRTVVPFRPARAAAAGD
jgi:GGDEF domain-containing protein